MNHNTYTEELENKIQKQEEIISSLQEKIDMGLFYYSVKGIIPSDTWDKTRDSVIIAKFKTFEEACLFTNLFIAGEISSYRKYKEFRLIKNEISPSVREFVNCIEESILEVNAYTGKLTGPPIREADFQVQENFEIFKNIGKKWRKDGQI